MQQTKRVAVIQDISGFGRCSMTTALPVLGVMGNQCCPLPTAYLSAHTGFPPSPRHTMLDMTAQMAAAGAHWAELGVRFDAIYSGFLGSGKQAEVVLQFYERFGGGETMILCDPVMGDHGRAYRTCTPQVRAAIVRLAERADVITPNLTEAALLLGEDYARAPRSEEGMREWLERLSGSGRRSVVLTGLSFAEGLVGAGCLDAGTGEIAFPMARRETAQFPGTGDLFASVLLGGLLREETLAHAAGRAAEFVSRCVRRTVELNTPVPEGVQFEPLLRELAG